jgi:hypothetical protein
MKSDVHRRDISDLEVCKMVDLYQKEKIKRFPYEQLALKFGASEKVAYSACERACKNGLIDYGVSLRTGWLTEKGEKFLKDNT